MELHFAGTANVFVYYPSLRKASRATALRSWERGTSGRWHIHCAVELPSHFDAIVLERLIRESWAKVEWGHGRIPRRCKRGLDQLYVEGPPEVRVRRFC